MGGSREMTGGPDPPPPLKSQVAIGLFRNSGTDTPREAIGPIGSTCSSRESVRPSMKYANGYKPYHDRTPSD